MAKQKPIGEVTHYFKNIEVAIVKFNKSVSVGDTVQFKGATTDFTHKVDSMELDHKEISEAKKGQDVGIKVGERVRVGDQVFEAV